MINKILSKALNKKTAENKVAALLIKYDILCTWKVELAAFLVYLYPLSPGEDLPPTS